MGRTFDEYGAHALTHVEMDAWSRLRGVHLTTTEFEVLRRLDATMLTVLQEHKKHG